MVTFPQMADFGNDFGKFSVALMLWKNQQTQDAQNQKAHDTYLTNYNTWMDQAQQLQAYGKPLPAVTAPPMKVTYNDDGSVTKEPFPDLHPEVLPPLPNPVQTVTGLVGATPPPTDRLDVVLMIVEAIAAKLGV